MKNRADSVSQRNNLSKLAFPCKQRSIRYSGTLVCLLIFLSAASAFGQTVNITSPHNGAMTNSSVRVHAALPITVTATSMQLFVDQVAGIVKQSTNVFDTTITLANGPHLLEVKATDTSNTVHTSAVRVTVATVAVNPPSISIAPGSTQQFSAAESASASIAWSATGGTISSGGLYTAGTTPGTFAVTASDNSGNRTTASVVIAPVHTVTIESPQSGSSVKSPILVHATYAGTVVATNMRVWLDGVGGTALSKTNNYNICLYLNAGSHTVLIRALDPSTGLKYSASASVTVASTSGSVTVTPSSATLQTGVTQQFTATDSAGLPVTWTATGGTISTSGLYTAGSTAGTFAVTAKDSNNTTGTATVTISSSTAHTVTIQNPASGASIGSPIQVLGSYNGSVTATFMKLWIDHVPNIVQRNTNTFSTTITLASGPHLLELQASDPSTGLVYTTSQNITVTTSAVTSYTTWKNDLLRTGQQRNENTLTTGNVNSTHFGQLFADNVDGQVYAQPLYVSNLSIAGRMHNVVFIETEHDSVYAFDADAAGTPLWQVSMLPGGATTVQQSMVGSTINPEIGITGTPVIDPTAGTMYLISETLENNLVVFRLHALNITTGHEQSGSPVVINATGWQPTEHLQRPGLLLANGNVYIGIGSQGDHQPYHGWVFAYNASSLMQVAFWNSTPTGTGGALWMGGSGLAADAAGNIFFMTGNGDWDGTSNFSDSIIKLSPSLALLDYFTPDNQGQLSLADWDLGSGGVVLVPDQSGAFPHELIGCGKYPSVFVIDRDDMGKYAAVSNSQVIQELDNQVGGSSGRQADDHCFLAPAFWEQNIYFVGNNDVIRVFYLDPSTGKLSATPTSQGTFSFLFPGGQPVVSSSGSKNGIVWVIDHSAAAALHAFDATNVASELYRSPGFGAGTKWAVPTVVNSKVYVGTATQLVVFGPM
jgi:hypothetical protein